MSLTLSALVVDDSGAMRKQLAYALQRVMGIHATEATDGADAWRKLSTGAYDVVLTDVNMPLMDGLKLISLIRKSGGAHQQVPIVVITTEGAVEDRRRAMDLGASAYLVKPVQSQQVVEALRSLLRLSA
ncbi:MAG TPA: response regulator [Anaeromyxobacteraceae bacterium]|jgi:two-component system chemotaxis response regulator CheY|nr:response regulator [Anaeromyxobacteraceae bacterium]